MSSDSSPFISSESSSGDEKNLEYRAKFFRQLTEKRGQPTMGGLPIQFFKNTLKIKDITISFNTPNATTSRSEYHYNARDNMLYRKKKINANYAVWSSISIT
jgi:hypothetical protein